MSWNETAQILRQCGVKNTPLTEKLLVRPPFRFIFDLCLELNTSFKIDQKEPKDKESKIQWLQHVIKLTGLKN